MVYIEEWNKILQHKFPKLEKIYHLFRHKAKTKQATNLVIAYVHITLPADVYPGMDPFNP